MRNMKPITKRGPSRRKFIDYGPLAFYAGPGLACTQLLPWLDPLLILKTMPQNIAALATIKNTINMLTKQQDARGRYVKSRDYRPALGGGR